MYVHFAFMRVQGRRGMQVFACLFKQVHYNSIIRFSQRATVDIRSCIHNACRLHERVTHNCMKCCSNYHWCLHTGWFNLSPPFVSQLLKSTPLLGDRPGCIRRGRTRRLLARYESWRERAVDNVHSCHQIPNTHK